MKRSRHLRYIVAGVFALTGAAAASARASDHGVIAGAVQRLAQQSDLLNVDPGELLIAELNCIACHSADDAVAKRLNSKRAPALDDVGRRITPQYLTKYLTDPSQVKPGTTMPNVFHASEAQSRDGAVEALVHYLVSRGGPMDVTAVAVNPADVARGEKLYHTVGCVACHEPVEPASKYNADAAAAGGGSANVTYPSVPLGDLASKTTVSELAAFLRDPLKVRPGGRMPSLNLSAQEATAIAMYLLRDQARAAEKDAPPQRAPGIRFAYYEASVPDVELSRFEKLTPKREGIVPAFTIEPRDRNDQFAFHLSGVLVIETAGRYTFYTRSDDGSRLYIDGELVVDNDRVQGRTEKSASLDLPAGEHRIDVTYYEQAGEESLEVLWKGPGINQQAIAASVLGHYPSAFMKPVGGGGGFSVDAGKAQLGAQMYAMLRCVMCHEPPVGGPGPGAQQRNPFGLQAPTLATMNADNPAGCIGDQTRRGLPKYDLTDAQRATIRKTLANRAALAQPLTEARRIDHTLAQLNCVACHTRGDQGGPEAARAMYFITNGSIDLGDEGRIPPTLTDVGGKLQSHALAGVLMKGESVRPYMAVRMPQFGQQQVEHLVAAFERVDFTDTAAGSPDAEPKFDEQMVKDGRRLVGTTGLACVNCHTFNGRSSLGVPAVDMGAMATRLRPQWFNRFLTEPFSYNKATRMPAFWLGGNVIFKDVADGDAQKQMQSLWAYLSLGKSMPLPIGMQPTAGTELVPDYPVIFRTFMNDLSPRAIAVGFPEQVHVAFDGNVVRLGKAWRGRFFDANSTWEGRAGGFAGPLGEDAVDMPPGPSFAVLDQPDQSWPVVTKLSRNVGGVFHGYQLDAEGRPTFRYTLQGVDVRESPIPLLEPGGSNLRRRFALTAKEQPAKFYFIAAAGRAVRRADDGSYTVDDRLTLKLSPPAGATPVVRTSNNQQQLLIPVPFKKNGDHYAANFEVDLLW